MSLNLIHGIGESLSAGGKAGRPLRHPPSFNMIWWCLRTGDGGILTRWCCHWLAAGGAAHASFFGIDDNEFTTGGGGGGGGGPAAAVEAAVAAVAAVEDDYRQKRPATRASTVA
jgi:hypothetical protein